MLSKNSLVLYKNRPAQISNIGDKLEIALEDGKQLKVREKDVQLLHSGPIQSLKQIVRNQVKSPDSLPEEVETAWELLAGETTTLSELAELIYGEFTVDNAWLTWQYVAAGLHFQGEPEAITVQSAETVAKVQAERDAKTHEKQVWTDFLARLDANKPIPEDDRFFKEVAALALGQQQRCRVLQALNQAETPENAHAFLLKKKYWDATVNPHPIRLGLPITDPELSLANLPDEDRRDLTHLPAFAIDDVGSTDPDDALSLVGNRLWVHIADVAALIPPNSPADLEARARGANLYLPDKTVHMLPPKATEILALGLAEISPALSFGLDLDDDDNITNLEIVPSWIRVQRTTYDIVEEGLDTPNFQALNALAQRLYARRQANDAVEIDLPEIKISVVDDEVDIRPLPKLRSRDLVREAMLLCGQALANFAQEANIPFPYTTQPPPEERISETGLADMFAQRRLMRPSQRTSEPGQHAGLGLPIYTQATSPLRRYADLVAHQQLRAYLRGEAPLSGQAVLAHIAEAEAVGGLVRQAERAARKHWTLVYLQQHSNWHGSGVVVELRDHRSLILIPELDLEIRLRLPDHYDLNDEVSLSLRGVDLPLLEAYFQVG